MYISPVSHARSHISSDNILYHGYSWIFQYLSSLRMLTLKPAKHFKNVNYAKTCQASILKAQPWPGANARVLSLYIK